MKVENCKVFNNSQFSILNFQFKTNSWFDIIAEQQELDYYKNLQRFLADEYEKHTVYPPAEDIFSAFYRTPYEDVKVVILGQDPYINGGQAHGMAFSVRPGAKIPMSLLNIFKELKEDLGHEIPDNGCLIHWATQGVLLLNTVLTVRAGMSGSHAGKGWEIFTDHIINTLSQKETPLVFMLWGKVAQSKACKIAPHHKVLTAAHPSPLAGGKFFGCRHFSKANEFLEKPIRWAN